MSCTRLGCLQEKKICIQEFFAVVRHNCFVISNGLFFVCLFANSCEENVAPLCLTSALIAALIASCGNTILNESSEYTNLPQISEGELQEQ